MPLWGKYDNAANSDIGALMQVNESAANTSARDLLFNNTTANTIVKSAKGDGNVVVGQFGVSVDEIQAANEAGRSHPPHGGWVLRHEGTGLKAGRVWYETLVATGSITSDSTDDTYFPNYAITITTQPTSNNFASAKDLTFTVAAKSTPSGASLSYQWQKYVTGNSAWVDLFDTVGWYSGATNATFSANNLTANGNVFRAVVSTTGANSVTSGSATITLHP